MARNRRNQSAAFRFAPALKAVLLCLLLGGAGVGYVAQKDRILQLSLDIKKREARFEELRRQNKKLSDRLAELRSPAFLQRRVRELNLGLVQPQPNQIWRLPEPRPVLPLESPGTLGPAAGVLATTLP